MHLHIGVRGDSWKPMPYLGPASWGSWAKDRLRKVRQRSLRGSPDEGCCRERRVPGKEASSQAGLKPFRCSSLGKGLP